MEISAVHADTFVRFVDGLEEALVGDALSTDEQAAQAFLSRSHFDRVIRAVGGEAPGAFRRRVLLERAAYQLATSDRTILEIALEAGYSSHEAFVRAFRRAYQVNPSDWRSAPRQFAWRHPTTSISTHPAACGCRPARR